MAKDELGNRMKQNYEDRYRFYLTSRTPVIIRLDGKSFHTLTRHYNKPFDETLYSAMVHITFYLCEEMQGAKCAYIQSDEISILLTDFDKLTTDAWFDYNIQKMVSVSAGMASAKFSVFKEFAVFDSRVANYPREEVTNYFIWRQSDWIRNSIQMFAQSYFSSKELHKKNSNDMHEMLYSKGVNWADLDVRWKNGTFIYKKDREWVTDYPIFKENRQIIERYLSDEEIRKNSGIQDDNSQIENSPRTQEEVVREEIDPRRLHTSEVNQKLKVNKAQCLRCGDIIESKYRHDFVTCQCGAIFIDGGIDYQRYGGTKKTFKDLSEWKDVGTKKTFKDLSEWKDVI